MSVTVATLTARAPELETLGEALLQSCVDEATGMESADAWGTKYDTAVLYRAMHIATLTKRARAGAVGPISAKSVGDVSVSYGAPSAGSDEDAALAGTPGGALYLQLRASRLAFGGFRAVRT
jgi:hypothetical protein